MSKTNKSNKVENKVENKIETTTTNNEETKMEKKDPITTTKEILDAARAEFKSLKGIKPVKSLHLIENQKRIKVLQEENRRLFAQIKSNKVTIRDLQEKNKALRKTASTPEILRQAKIAVLKAELAYQEACLG